MAENKTVAASAAAPSHRISRRLRSNLITYGIIVAFFVIMTVLESVGILSHSLSGQLVPICAYVCMAVSRNLVVGVSGELSLGHAGFMSVGAFSAVVIAAMLRDVVTSPALLFAITLVFGALMAALAGVLVGIPVMRLHGDYLAIVTLAFGEIIKNILNNLYVGLDGSGLHFSMTDANSLGMDKGVVLINGPQGAVGVTKASNFVAGIILVLVTVALVLNLMHSRSGRAIMAVRDNRIAAESVGINVTKYRLMAFVVAAALAGAAGALYGQGFSSFLPKKFDFNTSILVLVFVVLGGMGNIRGSIIAAAVLTVLPEVLRAISDWRMLIYAIVLIIVMIVQNNPTLKQFFSTLWARMPWVRPAHAEATEGGEAHE